MPPKKTAATTEVVVPVAQVKTKIESALWQTRELCRKHHLQTWGKESLANQIYQDLLFIYHIPRLCREGILDIDIQRVGDGKISKVSYSSLLSLKEPELINASFKRLCKELQRCILKDLFYGREFILFAVEKKNPERYMGLLLDLLKYFASIDLEGYDSNAGYTYFKKDLNKAIAKTFGQFYTPSTVTYSVVKLVDPKIGEKTLDPSCGSCSFLAESANYIVKKEGVDIKTAFVDLYGTEVEFNIYAEGIMNMFINFGLIPDMKGRIREVDALLDMAKSEDQFDKIVANPPFGADASTFHEFYFKTELEEKGKRMVKKIVVNPEVKCQIPFNKTKESAVLFFQFIVQKLKNGGKAGVVMSATILNDSYKEMMEWFLKCCSLEKVVINPAGTFKDQGTGIETFSFIFTKGKPTTTVKIVMLGAENDAVRTLTLDQIKEAGWKLQLKEEEKKVENEAFSYDEIKNLFEFEPGTVAASSAIPGEYPFMTLDDTATHSSFGYDNENLFISKIPSGTGSTFTPKVRYSNGKVHASSLMLRLIPKSERISMKFFYYFWKLKPIEFLRSFYKGAANKSLDQVLFGSFRFPIPPLPIQQEIVTALDLIYNNAATAKAAATSVKSQMAAVVRSVGARGFERKKLGDICEFNTSIPKHDTEYGTEIGRHPFYTGAANNKLFTDIPDVHHLVIIMNRTNGAGKCNLFIDKECSVAGQTIVFYMKDKNEDTLRYLYHYLNTFKSQVEEGYIGSNHKNVSNGFMESFTIELPPLPIQHEVLAILNEMEAELATLEQMAAKAEQRAKFILDGYLSPSPTPVIDTAVVESDKMPQNEIVENMVEVIKPAKRILKLKKTSASTS
jgi:type I restriction-modification system DNA methylase subunit/restriction endonuclease S subunit